MDDFRSKRQDEDSQRKRQEDVFSKRVRAGKKRTYFIDVKTTRNDDYYLTITESKRDFRYPNYYIKHKIFLYKEDFNKFQKALNETIEYVKTELLPDFEFDMYDKEENEDEFRETTVDSSEKKPAKDESKDPDTEESL